MNTTTIDRDNLCNALVEYFANTSSVENVLATIGIDNNHTDYDAMTDVAKKGSKRWDAAPCDAEGPTREQDEALDRIIDETAEELIALI